MKVCIVSPFFSSESKTSRPAFIYNLLLKNGCDVFVITSEFSHQTKKRSEFNDNIVTVKTIKYKKNTSVIRFISHLVLSVSLFFMALKNKNNVDIFYVTAPFAITALMIKLFSRKKMIVDIVDFWPNSLPFPQWMRKSLLRPWSWINKISYKYFDKILSVSSSFLRLTNREDGQCILLSSKSDFIDLNLVTEKRTILYMGNIGHLYDFDTLLEVLKVNDFRVEIIGDGDRRDWLLKALSDLNVDYTYHGVVYDDLELKKIVNKCHIGFNGYINTNASFSYKSLSYMSYGLPIINSMEGDLEFLVLEHGLGKNYIGGCVSSLNSALSSFSNKAIIHCHENVKKFFINNLEVDVVSIKILDSFRDVLENEKTI